ncbi:hypothetical protein AGMMS49960_13500 [Betaproteobacteria bacterium]|nr:hypothetical protein AGMMS49543_14470 [Betaproteobacteria bacterium]GHU02049.1 hypothetical protein AGMMS49960_13500 [Betaproteobacteria bacterium]
MTDLLPHPDPEVDAFEQALLRSLEQARSGEAGRVSTPADIAARKRGRPVGSRKTAPKVQTAIRFDPEVIAALKATGKGWQTRVNDVMREWVATHAA